MKVSRRLARFWPLRIKRWLPTSLFGRSLLIIILPVAMMQVAVTWAFFEAHWQTVTSQLSEGLAGDVAWDVAAYMESPTPQTLARLSERAEQSQSLSIVLQEGEGLPVGLMIHGRAFEDGTVLQVAHAYEQATAWTARRPPLGAPGAS